VKIFFDTEFTGLHQDTTLISIGLVADNGRTFYAELTDYDKSQVDKWIQENVIDNLIYTGHKTNERGEILVGASAVVLGNRETVAVRLAEWLDSFNEDEIEMWSDCLAYDWVLFCQLWRNAFNIPKCVYYIPFDLSTAFRIAGIDPDVNREKFSGRDALTPRKHNALWDAQVIKACHRKVCASGE